MSILCSWIYLAAMFVPLYFLYISENINKCKKKSLYLSSILLQHMDYMLHCPCNFNCVNDLIMISSDIMTWHCHLKMTYVILSFVICKWHAFQMTWNFILSQYHLNHLKFFQMTISFAITAYALKQQRNVMEQQLKESLIKQLNMKNIVVVIMPSTKLPSLPLL